MQLTPNFQDFLTFVRNDAKIPTSAISDDDPMLETCFELGQETVPMHVGLQLQPLIYLVCVYSFGVSYLLHCANDEPGSTYFSNIRKELNLDTLTYGLLNQASDQGTAGGELIPNAIQRLSLADLNFLKDPFGRRAISFLMELGPLWGLS